MSDIIRELEKEQLRTDLPKLEVGDTVRVFVKVVEGSRERLQNFEGIVIKMQGGGVRKTFMDFRETGDYDTQTYWAAFAIR